MGKRSGPAERLLQLLAGRWVPGAGELGVQRRARTEERKSSSSTCKRNTKRRQTHERKPARCEQAPALSRGRSLAALSGPTWLLPVGGGTLQSRPPLGPHESTASHALKSWGVVGGRGKPGDPVSAVCQPGTVCLSGVPAPEQGLGGRPWGTRAPTCSSALYAAHPGLQTGRRQGWGRQSQEWAQEGSRLSAGGSSPAARAQGQDVPAPGSREATGHNWRTQPERMQPRKGWRPEACWGGGGVGLFHGAARRGCCAPLERQRLLVPEASGTSLDTPVSPQGP